MQIPYSKRTFVDKKTVQFQNWFRDLFWYNNMASVTSYENNLYLTLISPYLLRCATKERPLFNFNFITVHATATKITKNNVLIIFNF